MKIVGFAIQQINGHQDSQNVREGFVYQYQSDFEKENSRKRRKAVQKCLTDKPYRRRPTNGKDDIALYVPGRNRDRHISTVAQSRPSTKAARLAI
jgi:hypothetical protein